VWDRDRNFLTEPPAAHPIPPSSNHHSHHHHHHHLQPLVCGWRHSTSQTPSSSYGPTFSAPVILTQHITMSHWTNNASNKIFLSYIQKKKKKLQQIKFHSVSSVVNIVYFTLENPLGLRLKCGQAHLYSLWFDQGGTIQHTTGGGGRRNIYIYMCVCVYIYIYIYTHTHTHTYIYTGSSELQRSALLQMNILYWLNILQ